MTDMNYTGWTSQPAYTCLTSTMEPPEQWVNLFKVTINKLERR